MRKEFIILIFVFFVSLFIVGCAEKNKNIKKLAKSNIGIKFFNKSGEKIDNGLFERFKKYWTFRKGVRSKEAYQFEVRHLMGVPYDNIYKVYIEKFNDAKVEKVEIDKVDSDGLKWKNYDEVCFTLRFYLFKKNMLGNKTFSQQDCWVNIDGEWFHLLNNPLLFKY